ncbi:MAG: Unknown protein [uncultured Sulfurovum sp.]|uniref:Lipid/polyisoprenoid-binding YceI-like domain-containing protein n=1 Tax=uncultured Sulfurovum sp. TaxID=269237 RepID=A0A6S6T5C3_9BACT|nr:MAG: Unknown protein [uncultured Sulfurovum sp.]
MKNFTKLLAVSVLTFGFANASQYMLDNAHSNVGFSVKHLMITNVNGKFKTYDANIDFDEQTKVFNTFKATVQTKSVDTGIEKRDEHLRSEDFFLSDKYPTMTFVMKSYKMDDDKDEGKMIGELTIRGITKVVTFDVEDIATVKDLKGKERVGFSLEGKINRLDYDLKWNKVLEFGGVTVGENVKIAIDVAAIKS